MGSGLKVHLGAWKYILYVIVNFDKFLCTCTAFGVLKDKLLYTEKKHSISIYILQLFYNLTLYLQLLTVKTWFIFAPNINQSTFGIDGIK